jgi:hypothetical protein
MKGPHRLPRRPVDLNVRTVRVPIDLLAELEPHAARRGISANKLVVLIIDAAIADNMIDAILDDGDA